MGTAINHPHRNPNPTSIYPRRRKRSPVGFQNNNNNNNNRGRDRSQVQDETILARLRAKNLVNGQVKILKRGEDLNPNNAKAATNNRYIACEDLVLSSTDRLGPEPETVLKEIRVSNLNRIDGIYAGSSAFFASPPPSSLPIPAFFGKKEERFDSATSDLRRLLRL